MIVAVLTNERKQDIDHREGKIGGGIGLIHNDKHNPSFLDNSRLVTLTFTVAD